MKIGSRWQDFHQHMLVYLRSAELLTSFVS